MSAQPVDVLTPQQARLLRKIANDGGFDFLDPLDFHSSGPLWFQNRDRMIGALQRRGYLDGDQVTEAGRAALARCGGA